MQCFFGFPRFRYIPTSILKNYQLQLGESKRDPLYPQRTSYFLYTLASYTYIPGVKVLCPLQTDPEIVFLLEAPDPAVGKPPPHVDVLDELLVLTEEVDGVGALPLGAPERYRRQEGLIKKIK